MVVLVAVGNERLLIAWCKGLMLMICAVGIKVSSSAITECTARRVGVMMLLLLLLSLLVVVAAVVVVG